MKFRNLGQALLAAVVSTGLALGVTSCANDHTVGYVYVTGTQYNQVGAYKEDNNNGVLTPVTGSPFGSGGTNPQRVVVTSNGRFMYVLNAGTAAAPAADGTLTYAGANISVFSIGGFGQISFQASYNSQGLGTSRIVLDSAGAHLYALDTYEPDPANAGTVTTSTTPGVAANGLNYACQANVGGTNVYYPVGDVTAFSIDSGTGRLTLVNNTQNTSIVYFPIGCNPVDEHITSTFLYAVDKGSETNNTNADAETVFVYAVNATSGVLTTTQNAPLQTGATSITAINSDTANKYIYLLDNTTSTSFPTGALYAYTVGTSGALIAVNGSPTANVSNAGNPIQLLAESKDQFAYTVNAGPAGGTVNGVSDISGYVINATSGQLNQVTTESPYTLSGTVSSPVCIFEDPTNQYLYTAGSADNTIAGRRIDPGTGTLTTLRKASSFAVVGTPSWCTTTSATH